jgi:hypothetical protein
MIGNCSAFVIVISLVEDAPQGEGQRIHFEFVGFRGVWVPEDGFHGDSFDEFVKGIGAFLRPAELGSFFGKVM